MSDNDDNWQNHLRTGYGILGLILFANAVIEMNYSFWGKYATGTVTHTAIVPAPNRGVQNDLKIDYCFTDAHGVIHSGSDLMDVRVAPPAPAIGDPIAVQYQEKGPSRPASRSDPAAFALFCAWGVVAAAWYVAWARG